MALPFFGEVEPEEVDVILITHFHLDHVAALPYFVEKLGFKGRIFMTHPTKAVMRIMLSDYIRVRCAQAGAARRRLRSRRPRRLPAATWARTSSCTTSTTCTVAQRRWSSSRTSR